MKVKRGENTAVTKNESFSKMFDFLEEMKGVQNLRGYMKSKSIHCGSAGCLVLLKWLILLGRITRKQFIILSLTVYRDLVWMLVINAH
jgi:hypothetical protein